MLRKSAISLAIVSALASMQTNALGLGEVTVSSALNQPLQAEIDLLQLRGLNASQVVTRFANTDDFYLAGVKPSPILSDIRFQLDIKGGQGKIVLTSSAPIREPFLNFLIEVNWPSGRLVREYTVLLDPPVFTAEDLAPRGNPLAPVAKPTAAVVPKPAAVASPALQSSASASPQISLPTRRYSVTKADTLWQIALKVRPDTSISPQQMMLAIQRMNPDAFIKNNINRLKSGVVLDIPTKDQILNVNVKESLQEVKRQNTSWKGAPTTADKPKAAKLDVAEKEMSSGSTAVAEDAQLRIVSKVSEEMPAAAEKSSTVASDTASAAIDQPLVAEISAKNEELEEQLVVTLEGLNKVERENVEMFDRLDRLSEQMESMQRLVELKDQQLAELQGRLAQKPAEPVVEPSSITQLPFEWLAGAGAALLALLAGLLLFIRKRKQQRDVDEALEQLNERDAVVPASAAATVAAVAAAATQAPLADAEPVGDTPAVDSVEKTAVEDVFVEADDADPFNMSNESSGPIDEFDAISDDELESALGEDLDMDLKLDEPVIDDPEMSAFSNSLLDDDEYDLSTGFDDDEEPEPEPEPELPVGMDDDSDLGSDLDALLSENSFDDADADLVDPEVVGSIEDTVPVAEEDDTDDDFDGDLDALLAENDIDALEKDEVVAVSEDTDTGDQFDGDLDALLAESGTAEPELDEDSGSTAKLDDALEDDFGSELDDLLADEGIADPLLDEDDQVDETLEQLLEDEDSKADSTGIERVEVAVDDDDIPDDDVLDALLDRASDGAVSVESSAADLEADEVDEGIDIEFDPIDDLDEGSEASSPEEKQVDALMVDALPEQVLDLDTAEEELSEFELDAEQDSKADLDLDDVLSDADSFEDEGELEDSLAPEGLNVTDVEDAPEVSDDAFSFELDDDTDDELVLSLDDALADEDGDIDAILQDAAAEEGTKPIQKSSLSLEDELDQADEAELEAELEQMLVSESNDLSLQETDLDDEEINYLDGADEVGTKIDLARAYIDMEDQEGASDILQEVIAEGSPEQVAEAKQLLESLKS